MEALGLRIAGLDVTAALLTDEDCEIRRLRLGELSTLDDWFERAGSRIGIVVGVPLLGRRLRFPFAHARKIQQAVPQALDEQVPGDPDEWRRLVRIRRSEDGGEAWVTMARQDDIRQILAALPENVAPRFLTPETLLDPPADSTVRLWIEADRATVVRAAAGAVMAGTITPGSRALDQSAGGVTLRSRLAAMVDEPEETWIVDGPQAQDSRLPAFLEAMLPPVRWQIAAADPAALDEPDAEAARRAALAARNRRTPIWNLAPRRSLLSSKVLQSPAVRRLILPASIAAILLLVVVDLGRRTVVAEARSLRNETTAIYERTFPGSRMIDPVRQMRAIVQRAGDAEAADAASGRFIDHLEDLSRAVTSPALAMSELRMNGRDWTLRGDAPDFAAVDALKTAIAGVAWARDVRVQRAEQTVDRSAIRFQLQWQDAGEQP